MKKIFTAIVACCLMMLITGCGGVKFTDCKINLQLDQKMLGTSFFEDTEILKRHLEDIPGYIAVDNGSGTLQAVVPLLPDPAFKPQVTVFKDNIPFYHSVIDQSAGVQGAFLKILAADLSAKQTADVAITETSEAYIPNEKVPWKAIAQYAKANPPHPGEKRYYVRAALLSSVAKTIYLEVSSNATVDGGTAFGVNGKVYATSKNTQTSNFAFIGTDLIDVDKIPYTPPGVMQIMPREEEYKVKVGQVYKSNWPKEK